MAQRERELRENLQNSLREFFASHGYQLGQDVELNSFGQINSRQLFLKQSALDFLIQQEAMLEDVREMPEMYKELVDFIEQVPIIQKLQLKPLLFAFFYHTAVSLFDAKEVDLAIRFFEKNRYLEDGSKAFHSIHDPDIKKLEQYLKATSLSKVSPLSVTTFATSLTETTYQALVCFLMDRSFTRFLYILSKRLNVTHVPIDHFTSRPDLIPGFIFHSTDQPEHLATPITGLLSIDPIQQAKKYLGEKCNFEIFDDDHNPIDCGFPLPEASHDRILSIASDLMSLDSLSKNHLPSCAYFTFQQENVAYDINNTGVLIAVVTDRNYIKLLSTNAFIDLDDNLPLKQINSRQASMVPRPSNGQGYEFPFMRTITVPKTYSIRFSPDSRLLLCGQANTIQLWSCETSTGFAMISSPSCIIWCVDWSPYGYHFVTGSDDCIAMLWTIDRSKPLRMFVNHQEPITAIRYHPNASTIATASYDRSVMLWDIRTQSSDKNPTSSCARMFAESIDIPRCIEFTRNGRIVICGDSGGKLSTWDIGEGRKIGTIRAHKGQVRDLTISQEGTILASTGQDGEIHLWEMSTLCSTSASAAEPLRKFQTKNSYTNRIVFSTRNLLHAIGTTKTPK
ncbi:transcription initiation factor TFIID subunit 5 [Histomonas meleagridis]|uniref:transcription initiation factor TFIID subunit 5 n=1 Tax=Histomonas meleagridis TaxID=135588 RepID=UPI003559E9D4|nr:transcription initiation factor TFIID subunit 5 [Histomonas meleagridis]KAH0805676.1 transcription initiation factor TFIID subunit 5 [Histomonas meleagridis]